MIIELMQINYHKIIFLAFNIALIILYIRNKEMKEYLVMRNVITIILTLTIIIIISRLIYNVVFYNELKATRIKETIKYTKADYKREGDFLKLPNTKVYLLIRDIKLLEGLDNNRCNIIIEEIYGHYNVDIPCAQVAQIIK